MKASTKLILICAAALALRVVFLTIVQHPGIADPNHYYNLGLRLVEGHGFTIDYVWHFYNIPAGIEHPDDFWMPLTGILAAVSMKVFGVGVPQALVPFVLLGTALPVVSYAAARQLQCSEGASLFAAAAAAFLPELALYSLRTDATLPNGLFWGGSLLFFNTAMRGGKWWQYALSGVFTGLAYMTRSDNIVLPLALGLSWLAHLRWGEPIVRQRWWLVLLVPIITLAIAAPWLIRNIQLTGSPSTPNLSRMFFFTTFNDHFAYGRDLNLSTLLAAQTPAQIIGKRLFEMAASIKTMYVTLDIFLPVAVIGGLLLIVVGRDRSRLLTMLPILLLVLGLYVFYTILAPFGSQGGSYKKTFVSAIPLLLPLAGYALERAIPDGRLRTGTMVIAVGLLGANAVEALRADARFTAGYLARNEQMAAVAETLPDVTGDGRIILMGQDPYMVRFVGFSSVMFPNEDRETILEVARRFGVDYLLMPPDRASIDALYNGTETDPRIVHVADVPGTEYQFFEVKLTPGPSPTQAG